MKLLLLLLALGLGIFVVAMIVMWYLFVIAFVLLIAVVAASFWITVMVFDWLTGNAELAQEMGIAVALVTFVGLIFWGYRSQKLGRPKH